MAIPWARQARQWARWFFNTCTASYQSLLSDPTYYGQIVAQTYPLVGNRGVEEENAASNIMANGYTRANGTIRPAQGTEALRLMNICAGAILWEFVGSTRAG